MNLARSFVYLIIKIGFKILFRVDAQGLERIPQSGPLIGIANHTGQVEVPLMYLLLHPRPISGWAKVETWDKPFFRWLFNLWDAVPIHRGEADMTALRATLEKLKQGYIFGIAPEGTRNKTGKLLRGHPGVALVAQQSKAPIIPLVHWGGENFISNLKHLRRTDLHVRVGNIFTIQTSGERISREQRQQIVDEMMYQLAALLPEEYRGEYADMSKATTKYLKFDSQPE